MPPATYPDPFALHVVPRSPLHAGWFGAQSWALQLAVAASQNRAKVQVETTLLEVPFALQARTSLPMQKRWPAVQTTDAQAPLTQT